jgi:hypothetical protein
MLTPGVPRLIGVVFLASLEIAQPASAQTPPVPPPHEHPAPAPDPAAAPQHDHHAVTLFPTRDASGTAWLPDATPMYGFHYQIGAWEIMLHGNAFLQLLHEAAPEHRGATQAGSINWLMAMARRPLGRGSVGLRSMISVEPWTITGCGYPNLLATGEVCDGDTIHDKQHPHDFFMEMAAELDRPLSSTLRWQLYGGVAGEPAIGPPAFPHRISAMSNPLSPIAHHWLDATHITFGVITTAVYSRRWKVEGSLFNGREPDERRYTLDLAPLDSVAGRLWFLPNEALALQVSAGYLNEAEPDHAGGPRIDVRRFTASATHHRRFGGGHVWATTAAWGANQEEGDTTRGLVLESSLSVAGRHTWFGRMELNGKPAHDLHIDGPDEVFTVGKLQGGYTQYLSARGGWNPGIGASVSAAFVPAALQSQYGGVGVGVGLFLTLRPAAHQAGSPTRGLCALGCSQIGR